MNIAEAKSIPLSLLVETLGGKYSHAGRSGEHWYFSPFRPQEKTASLKIDEKKNRWHDFGLAGSAQGNGGDIIDLWCDYNNHDRKAGVQPALAALQAYSNIPAGQRLSRDLQRQEWADNAKQQTEDKPRFEIVKLHNKIFFPEIIAEVQRRRISLPVANLYLKQVYLKDMEKPDRHMNGLAFPNMKGGYEISIPNASTGKSFKTSTRPKAPSFIKGKDASRIEIIEGFWDYLSLLEMQKIQVPNYDTYVLNSVSLAGTAIEEIKQFSENIQSVMLYTDEYQMAQFRICRKLESAPIREEYIYGNIATVLECNPVLLCNDPEIREHIEHLIKTLPERIPTLEEVGGNLNFMD